MRTRTLGLVASSAVVLFASSADAATLSVGPGKTYAKPCAAFAAAADGDTIEIDAAGSYVGDVCAIGKSNLVIRGVGGQAKIDAGGTASGGKAIWVVQGANTTIEDVEMFGCSVPDMNGAAIRQEGAGLTLRRVYFHDNQDGILAGADPTSVIVIEDSEFAKNGAGDGYSHNMYIGEIKSFTLAHSYSHDVSVGHLVKSRAHANYILYNRITDEHGSASYEIDLPQGGSSWIIGNVIEQAATTQNPTIITYAEEGTKNPSLELFVVNNTIVNDLGKGTFIHVDASTTTPTIVRNDVFTGPGTLCDQASAIVDGKYVGDPGYVNAAGFDYHLTSGSAAVNAGVAPGSGDGMALDPVCQYVHPTHAVMRSLVGTIDIGAFELGGETTTPCGGTTPGDAAPGDTGTGDTGAGGDGGAKDTGTSGGDGGSTDAAGDGGGGGGDSGDSGGCSCGVVGAAADDLAASLVTLAAFVVVRRRRRSRA